MDNIGTEYLSKQILILTPDGDKITRINKLSGIFKLLECQKMEDK